MKIRTILFLLVLYTVKTQSQNYQIDFTGSGASTTVDSVKVENLTQCKTLTLGGSDILQLVASAGIDELNAGAANEMCISPNPATGICLADFEATASGPVTISLYDIGGKRISQVRESLTKGHHTYQVIGLCNGIFTLKVESEEYCYNAKIVSMNSTRDNAEIKPVETIPNSIIPGETDKSHKSTITMQYTTGDLLKLTGKSGIYRTVFMLVPSINQTVTFNFVACTDGDGNNYSVVQIGSQLWMAENLNAGTYVPVTTPQASGTKFCQNYSGQNDPTCPMGGLYVWANLMQGAASCNGSGAPPNDKCTTPVQGLCPAGWHVPTHYEWTTLENNAGSNPGAFPYDETTISILGSDEGGNLKETCTSHWWAPNAGATNATGFTALPGGSAWQGVFDDFGQSGYYWSCTEQIPFYSAWVRGLNYSLSTIGRSSYFEESGFNVRCVKD